MNEIIQSSVYKTQKGTPVTDSVKVAQVFGKMHKNIMKSIRNHHGVGSKFSQQTLVCRNHIHGCARETTTHVLDEPRWLFLAYDVIDRRKGDGVQGGIHQRIQQDGVNDKGTCASIPGDSSNVRTGFAACGGTGGNNRKPTKAD